MGTKNVWRHIKDNWFILSREDIKDFVFFLAFFYISALFLFLGIEQDQQLRMKLVLDGVDTQAVVLRCGYAAGPFRITYEFEVVQNGQSITYKNSESSSHSFCFRYPKGSQVTVTYWPQNPNQVAVQGNSRRRSDMRCLVITLIYPWGLLIFRFIKAKRQKWKE
ncbi:MAG: DUF3592 domain-containing protein [Chloroflexi bacterium]|nr:DUF3592 domain-containing protein [Chloroflexota bacterium]